MITGWNTVLRAIDRGDSWKLAIHRYVEPRDWESALALVPEESRTETETYLRGIAQRMRNTRANKGA